MNRPAISHRHIEVFRAVMTAGSVTAAAATLHSSQPTLSRELARLEYLIGYALFERASGRLKPTARALSLFDEVQRSFQGLDRISSRAAQLGRAEQTQLSVLCLPALSHALLPGACARFFARYPRAQLSITPQESPLLEEWMSAQRFDLGLSEQTQAVPGTQQIPLLSLDEVCVLPAGHALLGKQRLDLRDFEAQDFIHLAADDPYRLQLDALFAAQAVRRNARLETHSAMAVCALVKAGLGVAIVNPLTALAMAGNGLELRPLNESVPFQVNVLLPQFRPAQALTQDLLADLLVQARQISLDLEQALRF